MPSLSTDIAVSCPFSSHNLHPFAIGDPHATFLVDEEESGWPENIPSHARVWRRTRQRLFIVTATMRNFRQQPTGEGN
jgi:hypothetical protein